MFAQASRPRSMLASTRGFVLQIVIALLLAIVVIVATVPPLLRAVPLDALEGLTSPSILAGQVP